MAAQNYSRETTDGDAAIADLRELLRVSVEQASAQRQDLADKVERAVAAFERLAAERKQQREFDEEIAGYLAGSRSAIEGLKRKIDSLQTDIVRLQDLQRRTQKEPFIEVEQGT